MQTTRIGGAALNQTPIDWDTNLLHITDAIIQAKKAGIQILCLPELCVSGYGCEDLFLSPWVIEESLTRCLSIVEHTENICVAVGLPLYVNNKLYNAACVISDKKIQGFALKQNLAIEGVHYESRWFHAWPANKNQQIEIQGAHYPVGDILFNYKNVRFGFEICEDAWVQNRPGIEHAKKGVDLILNPSASHFAFGKSLIRYKLALDGSKAFNCTYLYSNLLGNESGRMIYDGEVIIAQKGNLVQRNNRLSYEQVQLIFADIDFNNQTAVAHPLTYDEHDTYEEFWEATSLGLFDYLRKSKSNGFVLSLSGGADSSACAIMVAEMIRKGLKEVGIKEFLKLVPNNQRFDLDTLINDSFESQAKKLTNDLLTCVYQSTRHSGEETLASAKELAESIGARFIHWSVDAIIESYKSTIENHTDIKLNWEQHDLALQNIQARGRAPGVWMLANINRALLITTSNRSEGDVGYATMDGDTAGSIAPIAGVDKHFIRQWLIWAEKEKGYHALHRVNQMAPTAELRPIERNQTDEKDLMPYDVLAQIERLFVKDKKSPQEIVNILTTINKNYSEGELKNFVEKFLRMFAINQWKRERIAPSFHLDDFNIDPRSWFRFPILNSTFGHEIKNIK